MLLNVVDVFDYDHEDFGDDNDDTSIYDVNYLVIRTIGMVTLFVPDLGTVVAAVVSEFVVVADVNDIVVALLIVYCCIALY